MKRGSMVALALTFLASIAGASPLAVTRFTVVAKVASFESYRAFGGQARFSPDTPYGNEGTIVATIVAPEELAGREIAIPFESENARQELLVQPGTVFRFEHRANLADLRAKTDMVRRRSIAFPALGILVLKSDGEVAVAYPGSLTALRAAEIKRTSALR